MKSKIYKLPAALWEEESDWFTKGPTWTFPDGTTLSSANTPDREMSFWRFAPGAETDRWFRRCLEDAVIVDHSPRRQLRHGPEVL